MNSWITWSNNQLVTTVITVGLGLLSFYGIYKYKSSARKQRLRKLWNSYGKDVVILHQLPRGLKCPNLSPYPIKLELYLVINKIKYEIDYEEMMSSKHKSPWITLNGVNIADSQLSIEYLNDYFGKNMNSSLSPEEVAVSRAFRALIEDHLYFVLALDRWSYEEGKYLPEFAPLTLPVSLPLIKDYLINKSIKSVKTMVEQQAHGHGIGRHTREEVEAMGIETLKSLSNFLGEKDWMMGKNEPTEIDLIMFSFTVIILYASKMDGLFRMAVINDYSNLESHVDRMRERYWPNWPVYQDPKKY